MKTINSQIKKEEDSKIKKAFKKMKNAFIVGTAALMITCGGTETNSSSYKLPAAAETYAKENNLKDTYNISDRLGYDNGEMTDMLYVFDDFCSKKYSTTQIYPSERGEGDPTYNYIKLDNVKSPIEFLFKSTAVGADLSDLVSVFYNSDNHEVLINKVGSVAPITYNIYYDKFNDGDVIKNYYAITFSVFNHLYDKSEEHIKTNQSPAIIICYTRYDKSADDNKGIGRAVVIPYTMFMEEATKVMDENKIFELISKE